MSYVTLSKDIVLTIILYFRCFIKIVIIPLLLFNIAFNIDYKFCVRNMHITANMKPTIFIKARPIFSSKFVIFWGVTRGRELEANDDQV